MEKGGAFMKKILTMLVVASVLSGCQFTASENTFMLTKDQQVYALYDTKGDNDPLNDVAYTGTKLVLGNDGQWRLLTKNSAGEAAYKVIGTYNQNSAKDAFVRHYVNESFDQGNYDRTTIKNYMTIMAQNAKATAHLN
jgi:hypothetical protein